MSTTVTVAALPRCAFGRDSAPWEDCPNPARYDFRTRSGPWAYGCAHHYAMYRMWHTLGTGKGQRLEVEKSANV